MNLVLSLFLLQVLCLQWNSVCGTCTFPSGTDGAWEQPGNGILTFNSTHLEGYKIHTFTSFVFECHLNSGDYYIIRSGDFTIFGNANTLNAVTCLKFTQISSTKYYYHVLTTRLADANNERVKFVTNTDTVSESDVCNDVSVASSISEIKLMISNGTATSNIINCPNLILGTYYYYNHGTCSVSSWDVCADLTTMVFNYTQCSTKQAYSAGGVVNCLMYITSGSETIVYIYNTDASVDNSATYRYSCMAISESNSLVYVSMYPNDCYDNQTSTYVPSGGVTNVLSANVTCVPSNSTASTEQSSGLSAGLIAGIAIAVILVLAIGGVVAGYFILKKLKKVEPDKSKNGHAPDSTGISSKENTTLSVGQNSRDAVTPSGLNPQVDSRSSSHGKSGTNDPMKVLNTNDALGLANTKLAPMPANTSATRSGPNPEFLHQTGRLPPLNNEV